MLRLFFQDMWRILEKYLHIGSLLLIPTLIHQQPQDAGLAQHCREYPGYLKQVHQWQLGVGHRDSQRWLGSHRPWRLLLNGLKANPHHPVRALMSRALALMSTQIWDHGFTTILLEDLIRQFQLLSKVEYIRACSSLRILSCGDTCSSCHYFLLDIPGSSYPTLVT